ncbi:AAA family ATPase [Mycobacterium sp.]|uniref:AAA family ATPase n=1 Tax=Mycobacterium sp. TaxID=1785 RepID=UPI003F96BD1D
MTTTPATSSWRAQRDTGRRDAAAEKPALDTLTLSRKEGFRAAADAVPRCQPEQLSITQLEKLTEGDRRRYDRQRSVWHANLPTIETAQLLELHEQLGLIVASNQQDGEKAKGAIAIEGAAGIGKSVAVLDFAKEFHRDTIAEFGEYTEQGNERWPVCRVGMTGDTGMKDFNRAMLGFFNHAGINRGTAVDFANRALDCVLSCETKLLIVDDLHFLKQRTTSVQISNQFKYISNEFPLTIVFIGIGLRQRGLYSDGTYANGILGQSGRRITPITFREFSVNDDERRNEWRQLLLAIEKRIVLARKQRGMLVDLSDYLWERSTGRIGPLTTLINRGCQRAVRTGTEFIDHELLERVPLDAASESRRTEIRTAIEQNRMTTRPTRRRRSRPSGSPGSRATRRAAAQP